jgi:hypothetical protein
MAVEKINIRFDEDELTLGDLEDFEDTVGVPLFEALKPKPVLDEDGNKVTDEKGRPQMGVELSAKALKGLVWIVLRQERPGFTLEDARNVKVAALEIVGKDDEEEEAPGPLDVAAPESAEPETFPEFSD